MSMVFNAPHTWPRPPQGWVPPPGWSPDPSWPPAPPGWQFWVPAPRPAPPIEHLPAGDAMSSITPSVSRDDQLTGKTDLVLLRELMALPSRGDAG